MTALVLSQIFPPEIGGSGELLSNIYSRFAPGDVQVLADELDASRVDDGRARLTATRVAMRSADWGVFRSEGRRYHWRQVRHIRRATAGQRCVVHCGRALPEGLSARLAWPRFLPYTCWAHGEDVTAVLTSREYTWLARRVFAGAAAIFANSRNTVAILDNVGVPPARVTIVHPGVDAVRFHPGGGEVLRRRLAPAGETVILTVGRLQRRKGHDLTLRAVARLRARGDRVRYVVVGDGEERERLETLSRELGVAEHVGFEGAVSADVLPAYYAASDVFCHPNRVDGNDIEGFGMVFLEAAAAGLPVIGGASGGAPEAIAAGETGLLVSGHDEVELADALAGLVRDADTRVAMGRRGRERACRDFTWDRAASIVRDEHARILSDAR
jgi:phosphatidylinositol alpha-1,6-mannosyltransferase